MNGAQALFKALTDAGLDTCFANPGTSEMQAARRWPAKQNQVMRTRRLEPNEIIKYHARRPARANS